MGLQTHHPSNPLELVQGTHYQALVRLRGPLACFAGAGMLAPQLRDFGFDNVAVHDAYPSHFDASLKAGSTNCGPPGEMCCRWVSGRWVAPSLSLRWPTEPAELLRVWSADSPTTPAPLPDPVRPEEPGPSSAPSNPREALAVLTAALAAESWGDVSPAEVQALLSVSRFEGGWGGSTFRGPDGKSRVANRNNWGAIHCTGSPPSAGPLGDGCVSASDTRDGSEGTRYAQSFRAYATPLDGARDFLRFMAPARDAMKTGDADVIAQRMKVTYRYGAPVEDYAKAILVNAASNAKALGVPLAIFRTDKPDGEGGGATGLSGAEVVTIGSGLVSAGAFVVAFFAADERHQKIAGGVGVVAGLMGAIAGAVGRATHG